MTANVLVVDDDLEIRRLMGRYLDEHGFRVFLAGNRRECEDKLASERIDIAILDVLLPDGSGLDLCRMLQTRSPHIPVILLTALKEEVDRIIGLELGADDYMSKPFSPRELLARMRAVLRRTQDGGQRHDERLLYRFAQFRADPATREVADDAGRPVPLTGAEFRLLLAFLERPGRVLSRDQLLDLTQGGQASVFDRSVDVLVSRLRRKFREAGNDAVFKTVRNGGYQFTLRVERQAAER
jgi:Response regulators consisting of a CheY-like receiver domain and a winged-helix DNA-binding domain